MDCSENRWRLIQVALLLVACALVQGCFGGGVLKKRTQTVQDPVFSESVGRSIIPRASEATNTAMYTATWLTTHWGKPASVKQVGSGGRDEIWTYRFGRIWEGIMPVFVVPIPLALPVAAEKVELLLRDGAVISATLSEQQTVGGAIGISPVDWQVFGPFSLEGFPK